MFVSVKKYVTELLHLRGGGVFSGGLVLFCLTESKGWQKWDRILKLCTRYRFNFWKKILEMDFS